MPDSRCGAQTPSLQEHMLFRKKTRGRELGAFLASKDRRTASAVRWDGAARPPAASLVSNEDDQRAGAPREAWVASGECSCILTISMLSCGTSAVTQKTEPCTSGRGAKGECGRSRNSNCVGKEARSLDIDFFFHRNPLKSQNSFSRVPQNIKVKMLTFPNGVY